MQHPRHLVEFALQVGIEQRLVTFATTPQNIVLAAKLHRRVHAGLDGRSRIGKHIRIRIGRGARHEAAVGEQVRRAPEQFYAGLFLLLCEVIDDLVEVLGVLRKRLAFRAHVGIVEAVIGCAEQREHLEGDIRLQLGLVHLPVIPRTVERASTKGVSALPGKRVPIGDRKAQMIFHPLARNYFIWVVEAIGQRIGAVRPLVFDLGNIPEKSCTHMCFLLGKPSLNLD
ncbi:hypothetical protein D3C71_1265620 [compost metagenome]